MMKKYIQHVGTRILSCLLCTICVLVLGVAAVGSVFYAEMESETAAYKDGQQRIADSYALYALSRVVDGDRYGQSQEELEEFLAEHNVQCEITLVEQNKGKEKSSVLYTNGTSDTEWQFQTEVVKGTYYTVLLSSLWSALGNSNYCEPESHWMEFNILEHVYDINKGIFYYETEAGYFPIKDIYVRYTDETPGCDYTLKTIDGKQCYYNSYYNTALDISQYKKWDAVDIGYNTFDMEEDIVLLPDSSVVEENLCNQEYYQGTEEFTISCNYEGVLDTYVIQIGWDQEGPVHSYFSPWQQTCTFIYSFQDHLAGIVVLFFLLFMASFVVLIFSTASTIEQLGVLHRVPLGIYSGVVIVIEMLLFLCIEEGIGWVYYNSIQLDVAYTVLGIIIFLMVLLAFMYLQNVMSRIRTRSLIRYSEIHYALAILKWTWSVCTNPFRKVYHYFRGNVSLLWKGLVVFVVLSFVELMFFAASNFYGEFMMFWIIVGKCIAFPVILYVLVQMKHLQEGTKRIASGDLSTPIDTSKMLWEFKSHGENINNVSQNISLAVEQQMKSERFKTELITNVSHDIKTPLTSIINYVDLIKKEEITDEKLCEYVEVLDRQSARLKKLIEDLMEASKASTGNLAVNLEECDVEVLLTQIIGEFEERLQNNQLEVIVDKPEHPVQIKADGRHMWRVLDNLLSNACKYAMPNTRVYVSLAQQNNQAVVVFKNISKVALNIPSDELMERFVRGDSSRNTEGSGLGLSIAQSLTELMNGSMKLDIDGDLFKVTLRFPL